MFPPTVHVPSDASDKRKQTIGGERGGLRFAERDAQFANHHVAVDVDLADRTQALGRNDDLLAAEVGRLPADKAGVAALRNHGRSRLVAEGRDVRDFLGRAWPHQSKRLSPVELPWLDQRAREQSGVRQHMP